MAMQPRCIAAARGIAICRDCTARRGQCYNYRMPLLLPDCYHEEAYARCIQAKAATGCGWTGASIGGRRAVAHC